mgnify:FL=1
MANVSLRHVYKIYDGGVTAVTDFNLEIADKEFIILVGPSGCGKSTTLRMIAGLEDISKGELYIGDTLANDVAPKDRDIAMVFQNYALYPHMTVYDNMAFGLKLRKFSKEEIKRRVEEAARILGIEQYLDRKPKALSGGQRQRVALGRAIVRNPKVFLLDEPLSNLDAKLRAQMRTEISKIYQRLGTTFIYVTHDQTEAMTMGTRIVVMKDGFIQQVDTPQHLYDMPCNMFVAGFIGSPQMNFINAVLSKNGGKYTLDFDKYHVPVPESKVNADLDNYVGKEVVLGIRPEHVHDEPEEIAKAECLLKANVDVTELMGAEIYLYVNINGTPITARVEPTSTANPGDDIEIAFDLSKIHIFDKDTEKVGPVRSEYTRLLGEVGDRVLNGYQMEQVTLQLGTQTQVTMVVSPWNEVITDVFVDLQFSGVEENTAALLQSKLPELQKQLEDVLQGSSADASDWAGGVLRRLVREKVEAELPEFRAAVDVVREDRRTVIQVVVYPVGQLVQSIDYEMVSQSIPNLLLLNIKQRYAQKTQELRGLPVMYVSRHKEELERSLLAELSAEPEVKRHNLRPSVVLTPGVNSGVRIRLESDEYKIWFEGYGDIGRNENNISGRAHFGKYISKRDEIFGEVGVTLDDVDWDFSAGYALHHGKTTVSYMRRSPLGENVYRLEQDITPKWRLRAEYFSGSDTTEIGVRYRIHEFLSAEYVYSNDKPYFRIVGNL